MDLVKIRVPRAKRQTSAHFQYNRDIQFWSIFESFNFDPKLNGVHQQCNQLLFALDSRTIVEFTSKHGHDGHHDQHGQLSKFLANIPPIWGWVKTLVPCREPQNSWDWWMFIPLKMCLYPYSSQLCASRHKLCGSWRWWNPGPCFEQPGSWSWRDELS